MLKGYNSTLDANVPSLALIAVVEPSQEPNLNLIPYSWEQPRLTRLAADFIHEYLTRLYLDTFEHFFFS